MYIIVRCPRCGSLLLAKTDNKTRQCTNCGHKSELRTLRVYGKAKTPNEASELMMRLKEKDGPGEGYNPMFKRLDEER